MSELIPPEACKTIAELRVQIDAIDVELITLLDNWTGYIDRAVDLKKSEGLSEVLVATVDCSQPKANIEFMFHGWKPALCYRMFRSLRSRNGHADSLKSFVFKLQINFAVPC